MVGHPALQFAEGRWKGTTTVPCCSIFAVAYDLVDPTVAVEGPSGTLTEPRTITAVATDNVEVKRVEFFVDGTKVGTDTVAPYAFDYDPARFANGTHEVRAVAYDGVENDGEGRFAVESERLGPSVEEEPKLEPKETQAGLHFALWFTIAVLILLVLLGAGFFLSLRRRPRATEPGYEAIPAAAPAIASPSRKGPVQGKPLAGTPAPVAKGAGRAKPPGSRAKAARARGPQAKPPRIGN